MKAAGAGSSGDLVADRRYEWARGYAADGDAAAAADLFAQALERAPGWPAALVGLGDARTALGDVAAAEAAFRRAVAADPADTLGAGLKLAALGAAPPPPSPPEAYVRSLFDDYAGRFETALVEELGYRTPWRMGEAIDAAAPGRRFDRAIDLGCGTGLMGGVLRSRCVRLEGVDLSPGMVAEAARKGIYDRLTVAEVVAHLAAEPDPVALVAAADVFVYLGDLGPVFAAVAGRLEPDGLFVFSTEAADGEGYTLRDSLRYAHGKGYIADRGEAAGFAVVSMRRTDLRLDRGEPVAGWIAVLRRR